MGLGKFIKRATRKVENFAHRVTGQPNIGDHTADQNAATNTAKAPVLNDEARRRAAGAGTVGFTGKSDTP
jgi:hypothetical protein